MKKKNGVKIIQTAGYNGARTVCMSDMVKYKTALCSFLKLTVLFIMSDIRISIIFEFPDYVLHTPYSDGLGPSCTTLHKSNRLWGLETIAKCKMIERIC